MAVSERILKIKLLLIILGLAGWITFPITLVAGSDEVVTEEKPSYVIGSSDEIKIAVLGYPELLTQTIISPDGYISFPFLGRVQAAGQSIQELTQFIQRSLESYIYDPQVTISLLQMHSRRYSVLGEVKNPGIFPLGVMDLTVYEAIAQAEGFLPTAYPQEVRVLRADGSGRQSVINLDMDKTATGFIEASRLVLKSGDVVYVPGQSNVSNRFSVLGEVRRPGVFPMEDLDMTVYEAIAQAEGFMPTAYKQQVSILRPDNLGHQTALNINLADTALGRPQAVPLKLRPGDIVYVPGQSDSRQVCVIGKVAMPGRYHFNLGMTVMDVLTAAGWVTKEGVANSIILVRRNGEDREFKRINALKVVTKRDFSQDISLQPGDIVYVPEKFISKLSTFAGFFSSSIEPVASSYLRVYDATNPSTYVVDR